jgi:membrane-associated phospholipid phosphatase
MNSLIILTGNYLILGYLLVPVGLWFFGKKSLAVQSVLAAVIAYLFSSFVKDFFYLPRPFILAHQSPLLGVLLDGSFPSAHTAVTFAVSLIVVKRFLRLGIMLCGLSILVGISRILGGVHSAVDVIGGLVLGYASVIASNYLRKNIFKE